VGLETATGPQVVCKLPVSNHRGTDFIGHNEEQ